MSQCESDPLPGLRAGRGAHQRKNYEENDVDYEVNYMSNKRTGTSLSVCLFDMVAELAIKFA
eukprot:6149642-Amphidinium_carterae.1